MKHIFFQIMNAAAFFSVFSWLLCNIFQQAAIQTKKKMHHFNFFKRMLYMYPRFVILAINSCFEMGLGKV